MISIEAVAKRYGRLQALRSVHIDLAPAQVVAVIGPNGSGKTTLIKCILGMVLPDSGHIRVMGKAQDSTGHYRQHIGYMPQITRFPDNLSISQLITMMRDIRQHPHAAYDDELLHSLGLSAQLHKKMGTLSGGTRQKVSAYLAFLFTPDILILDEPSAGLDPLAADILLQKIQATRAAGRLVIITSHIMSEVELLADRVLYLQEGTLRINETPAALLAATQQTHLSRAIATHLAHHA